MHESGIEPADQLMAEDYEFEVTITAVGRVRAKSESVAREVIASSALASPSADVIRLANYPLSRSNSITLAEADEWQQSATWRVERRRHRRGRGGERER